MDNRRNAAHLSESSRFPDCLRSRRSGRGHDDGVAPDEWVAAEYAKVRRLYTRLGIPERTEIEFFQGGHWINGQGTFDFLHRHLDWPTP